MKKHHLKDRLERETFKALDMEDASDPEKPELMRAAALVSIAISLQRIATAMEGGAAPELVWISIADAGIDPQTARPVLLGADERVYFRTAIGDSPKPVKAGTVDWVTEGPGKPTHYARV